MTNAADASFLPIREKEEICDIEAEVAGRKFRLLGPAGSERELAAARQALQKKPDGLPVLLGSGLGHALAYLLENSAAPVAIIDAEKDISAFFDLKKRLDPDQLERILWIDANKPEEALRELSRWQEKHGGKPFAPVISAFYQRLRPDLYGELRKSLEASAAFNFWEKARTPRFKQEQPRVLLLASKYFLIGEVEGACKKLGLPYKLLMVGEKEVDSGEFVRQLLETVITFKPDCAITLNHMGVDREGVLMELLGKLQLPLASWFVDNPHLIIHSYNKSVSPWTTLFTWDFDNLETLRARGYENVRYLPLATDPDRFRKGLKGLPQWKSRVSFVGNSMIYKVAERIKKHHLPKPLLLSYKKIADGFAQSNERQVETYLKKAFPEEYSAYMALPEGEDRLAFETALTWQATRVYRNGCVAKLLPFDPLIVGDKGWKREFKYREGHPRYLDAISYYSELPSFYGMSDINFNCTSRQMKGSVNQRVFDVPATGSFVLTDWQEQMGNLFEKDEMAYFTHPDEIPDLCNFYLNNPTEREKVAAKARKRVLAHHKWEDRVQEMLSEMRKIYG